jgi:hypothetical protein
MAVLDCSPSALKILYNSNEFMPYVVFMAAPGLDEMRHIYENGKMAGAIMASQRTLNNFEKTSSIRRLVGPSLFSPSGLEHHRVFLSQGLSTFPILTASFYMAQLSPGLWIRIRIGSLFNRVCGSGSVFGIRIRIQEGKNDPQKKKKMVKVHVLKCWRASFES